MALYCKLSKEALVLSVNALRPHGVGVYVGLLEQHKVKKKKE